MDGSAGTIDPNSSLDFSLNKYDMIKRRRRTAKAPTLRKKEVVNDNSENDEIVIDSDSSVRRSDTSAILDKFDMIKNRRRSCEAPTLHRKGVVKEESDDCGLVIDSDESTTKRQTSKVNKKKMIRKSKASVIKDSDSESDESESNANCRLATKKKCRGRPRKKFHMKSRVKNETKSVKSCLTNGSVKSDDSEVITLEDTDEEIKSKQTKSKNPQRKTRKNAKVKNNIQTEKRDLVEHLKSANFALGKKTVRKEKGMELKTSSAAKGNGRASLSSSDDDAVVLGYKLNGRSALSSDLDENVKANEEYTNTLNEFRLASKIQEEREIRVDEVAIAKKKPTPVVIVKDCLKTKLMTQIRGDFQLGSESESEEEEDGHVIMEEDKARMLARLKGDLQLPSESDSDGEMFSDDSDKNEVLKTKNKMKGSSDCNVSLVTGQSKKDNKFKSKSRITTPATRKPVKSGEKRKIQNLGHVIKVKIGGAKTSNNVDGKEFKGKTANYTKKIPNETKEASLENCMESPDESVKNENEPGLKSTSESFVKAKYLVMQKRGFNPKLLIEKGSFEEQFRKKLMRADILKLAQSMDGGCVNTVRITDNMFDDCIEPENVVVSVKPEDLLGVATVKEVKVDVNSTFSSDSDADDVEETLEEKMMSFLKNLKSSKFPEQTVPASTPKRNNADDNLLERKMTKLVDLINSVGSVKCVERCWDKVISKTVQKSMPCVQLEETTKKFAEIQRQLNRERWLRNVCSNIEEDVPVAVKKEPPKPEVTFQPLKSTKFKIPKKTKPKKGWTKTAEMWRQALKVDDNGCYKVNETGRRVLCKTHPRKILDYTEVDFKDDAVKKPEIKGEVQVKRCDDKRFGVNMKTRCSSPDKPLFTSSPQRIVPEDGPLLTSAPRRLVSTPAVSTPATKDLLLDISGSSDTLAGNLSYFAESISSDHGGFDETNESFDGESQNEEVAADVLNHSKETRVRSPFAFEDLPKAAGLGERRNDGKDWKGNTLDNPVVKENGKSNCEEEQSTKSMFSSLFKRTLNKRKT